MHLNGASWSLVECDVEQEIPSSLYFTTVGVTQLLHKYSLRFLSETRYKRNKGSQASDLCPKEDEALVLHPVHHCTSQISQRSGVNLWSFTLQDISISAWWWLNVRSSVKRPRRQAKCWGFSGWWILHSFCSTSSSGSWSFSTASLSFMYCLSVWGFEIKQQEKKQKTSMGHNYDSG